MTRIGRLIGTGFFSVILRAAVIGGGSKHQLIRKLGGRAAAAAIRFHGLLLARQFAAFAIARSVTYSSDTACVVASGFGALLAIVRPRNRASARGFANNTLMRVHAGQDDGEEARREGGEADHDDSLDCSSL